jgi:hypothetical protein
MIDRFTRVAHEAAKWTWPVVHVPLPAQRRIGGTPRPSTLFWPSQPYWKSCLETLRRKNEACAHCNHKVFPSA